MSDDKNNETGAAGGPLRPSGKRQISGDGSAAGPDGHASARIADVEATGKSTSGPNRVLEFPKSVGSEVGKVIWPTSREMVTYSIVTIVFLIVITALCTGVDMITGEGIEFMFGL